MSISQTAYIKLTPHSYQQSITVDEVKKLLLYFKEITSKTGEQLAWNYNDFSFPYVIKETDEGKNHWFYLSSQQERYKIIVLGVSEEYIEAEDRTQTYVQVSLLEESTSGDKSKANEYCKFLSKKLKGELHMFNKRVIYHYSRK